MDVSSLILTGLLLSSFNCLDCSEFKTIHEMMISSGKSIVSNLFLNLDLFLSLSTMSSVGLGQVTEGQSTVNMVLAAITEKHKKYQFIKFNLGMEVRKFFQLHNPDKETSQAPYCRYHFGQNQMHLHHWY
jgi:hypothetical protein